MRNKIVSLLYRKYEIQHIRGRDHWWCVIGLLSIKSVRSLMMHWWVAVEARGGGGCGSGEAVNYALHTEVELLKFVDNRPEERLKVGGVVCDRGRTCLEPMVRVIADGGG